MKRTYEQQGGGLTARRAERFARQCTLLPLFLNQNLSGPQS